MALAYDRPPEDFAAVEPDVPAQMTIEQFLAWDGDGSERVFELVNGEPRAMAPANGRHPVIQANLSGLLWSHLKGTKCHVMANPGVRPRLLNRNNLRVPDISVTCERTKLDQYLDEEPWLVAEILSPSNVRNTLESLAAMQSIPTLREIVTVDSRRVEVEVGVKSADRGWDVNVARYGPGDTVRITCIDATFTVADIYEGTGLLPSVDDTPVAATNGDNASEGDA